MTSERVPERGVFDEIDRATKVSAASNCVEGQAGTVDLAFDYTRWLRLDLTPGEKGSLPIWHEIDQQGVAEYSPTLADRLAIP